MSLIVDFSIFPLGKEESVSPYVVRAARIIRESGLSYRFGAMGTAMEGDWEDISAVISRCMAELGKDCGRLYFSIKGDYRVGPAKRLDAKVRSLEEE